MRTKSIFKKSTEGNINKGMAEKLRCHRRCQILRESCASSITATWISIWREENVFPSIFFLLLPFFFYWHWNDYYFCADEIFCQLYLVAAWRFQITKLRCLGIYIYNMSIIRIHNGYKWKECVMGLSVCARLGRGERTS